MKLQNLEGIEKEIPPSPEQAFEAIMLVNVLESYRRDMKSSGFTDDQFAEFQHEIANLNEGDIKKALSFPFELRARLLGYYKEELAKNSMNISEMVNEMLSIAKNHGYDIGYHTTSNNIIKKEGRWDVIGREKDHRDDDLPMAYYSREYDNIYKNKPFNYIYIIRSSENDKAGADNKWYRAPRLSIVTEIEMSSVAVNDIRGKYQEYGEKDLIPTKD